MPRKKTQTAQKPAQKPAPQEVEATQFTPTSEEGRGFVWATREDRREMVWYLVERGFRHSVIGRMLHPRVHRHTVALDIEAIRRNNRNEVAKGDPFDQIGDSVAFYRAIEMKAIRNWYDIPPDSGVRPACLNVALRARAQMLDLCMEAGLIERVPARTQVDVVHREFAKLTTEELRQRLDQVMNELSQIVPRLEDGGLPDGRIPDGGAGDEGPGEEGEGGDEPEEGEQDDL